MCVQYYYDIAEYEIVFWIYWDWRFKNYFRKSKFFKKKKCGMFIVQVLVDVQFWDFTFNAFNSIHSIQNIHQILNTLHSVLLLSLNWWTKKTWHKVLICLEYELDRHRPMCNPGFQYALHHISFRDLSQSFWAYSKVLKIVASWKASPWWMNFNSPKSCPHPFYWAATAQLN